MIAWFCNILFIGFISYSLHRKAFKNIDHRIYWSAFSIKLIAGIALGLIFTYLYRGGDSFSLFEIGGNILAGSQIASNQPRVIFFAQCLVPFIWITNGSYWLTSLYLSSVSFFASGYFVSKIIKTYPEYKGEATICFLFIPTVVFWSSGILKGTLSNAALVFLVAVVIQVYQRNKLTIIEILIGTLSLFILLNLKHYLFITFVVFIGLLVVVWAVKHLKGIYRWVGIMIILSFGYLTTQNIHPYLTIERLPQTIYENNLAIRQKTDPDKWVDLGLQNSEWTSVLRLMPKAVVTGLFRPSIYDKTPHWGIFHKIENLLILSLSIFSLMLLLRDFRNSSVDWTLVGIGLACIILLAALLALTTPNFGSLVRYRNAFLPFLSFLVSILPYQYLTSKTKG